MISAERKETSTNARNLALSYVALRLYFRPAMIALLSRVAQNRHNFLAINLFSPLDCR
jgi:hypothetical protein